MGTWTRRLRDGVLTLAITVLTFTVLPVHAEEQQTRDPPGSQEETIGVATGFTVGALAGGPFGAVVGAAAGALLGDRLHRETSARRDATQELASSREQNASLAAQIESLATQLDRVHELESDVVFRTEEASVSEDAAEKLYRLGTLLAGLPETQIRISGHADARGTDRYNLELSERRAAAVSAELAKAGVPSDRIVLEAHGESAATGVEGDVDTQAFERRVTIRVERGAIAVAQGR
jgi:outer membrane protein OmpA-like peptidoglycan-associated protein